jgi:mevalonate kinase
MSNSFYSHGKLLLTGEYAVLDGAKALGLPTKYGQDLQVSKSDKRQQIHWKSLLNTNEVWLDLEFTWDSEFQFRSKNPSNEALVLSEIFSWIAQEKPSLFHPKIGYHFSSTLEFPKDWGLGSSSTLINNLAQWAEVDAFQLQDFAFGGSGYDVACAQNSTPILYSKKGLPPSIEAVLFNPDYADQLFFVYLNKKQNSRDAIQKYRNQSPENIQLAITQINAITQKILKVTKIEDFEVLIKSHEQIIGSLLNQLPIQKRLFSDYPRAIKSLGAWGGDFVLATGGEKEKQYFIQKGFTTVLSYAEMIL